MLAMRIMASVILGFVMSIYGLSALYKEGGEQFNKNEKKFCLFIILLLVFVVITIWVA